MSEKHCNRNRLVVLQVVPIKINASLPTCLGITFFPLLYIISWAIVKMRRLSASFTWTNSSSLWSSDAPTIQAIILNSLGGVIIRALSRFKSDATGGHGNVVVETFQISCFISSAVANRSLKLLEVGDDSLFASITGVDFLVGCSLSERLSC